MSKYAAIEKDLLRLMPKGEISTGRFLYGVELLTTHHPDDIRYAYWTLIKEGLLERTTNGVRKRIE